VHSTPEREKPLVLIVDDDPASRELLATYLEPEGCTVVLASSGTEAVEEATRSLPDLIVTDVLMPGPGGLQTLFVLRNTPQTSHIPAIVVSGISPRILGLMPAAAYLAKPVERRAFVQAVRKYITPSSDTRQRPENPV
jgi:two-component system, OmpR family, alkaline phosphatase synthesis response regulator PhoP